MTTTANDLRLTTFATKTVVIALDTSNGYFRPDEDERLNHRELAALLHDLADCIEAGLYTESGHGHAIYDGNGNRCGTLTITETEA